MKTPEKLPKSVDDAIANLTGPPTAVVGQGIKALFNIIFGHVIHIDNKRALRYKYNLELYEKQLSEQVNRIPVEYRIEPDTQVVLAALEDSKLCIENETLRTMFVNLITAAIDSRKADSAHPSFASIIRNMSTLDAKMLMMFRHMPLVPIAKFEYTITAAPDASQLGNQLILHDHLVLFGPEVDVFQKAQALDSLSRHGLVMLDYTHQLTPKILYDGFNELAELENIHERPQFMNAFKSGLTMSRNFTKGVANLTALGNAFMSICLPDEEAKQPK